MISTTLVALAAASVASLVGAQDVTGTFPPVPLASKHYNSPQELPYKVDTDVGLIRGLQAGYNICNSTTETQASLCQTSYFNSADDFCIWGPHQPDSVVGDTEGEMVAWCTKPGHGTRLIPAGALTGLQWIQTPDYVQAVGFMDQSAINIKTGDWGGEMDPHGADLRGNPMGGVIFSTAFGGVKQVMEWHNFIGGGRFCFKSCDPAGPNAAHYCEHVFDRIGCDYNIPNAAKDGVFESCKGDNQDFPGIYTENGVVMTYTQPAESLGAISTMPYQPKVPASSECSTFTSSVVYTGLPSPTKALVTGSSTATGTSGAAATGTGKGASAGSSSTGTAKSASATGTDNGSSELAVSLVASFFGVAFAAVFLS
ncbi:hypothetical protein FA13DRAFT_1672616 [Coprinellus micaceus]|uniref:Macrofage activating glyco protein n=1 Tax=Coprinellus micaceus TaxID=71717 RepID=A0A4Y7SF75_COPMI|nr:hypothetical protein FA13DRAFT_1672616 [Coprinellus micaceus]